MILAFIFGIILRSTQILNIIHELFHYAMCNAEGIKVIKMDWSQITYVRYSVQVMYAGYMGEFYFYGLLSLIFSAKHIKISMFFLGIMLTSWVTSFFSYDFNEYALKLWGNQKPVTEMLIFWGIWSSILLAFLGKILYKSAKRHSNIKEKKDETCSKSN